MITIILPIRNEREKISGTLDSILSQSYKGKMEIIIADGMSTDGTREIIDIYKDENPQIHIIDNPEKIVSTGFNRALTISKGGIIIRIDGHAEVGIDFIVNNIKVLKNIKADCVGGFTYHTSKTLIGKHISVAQSSKFGSGGASFRSGLEYGSFVDTLAFGAYKRGAFLLNGGFDEELIKNQDEEFNYRLIQNGGKIWMDPSITSIYYVRDSMLKLSKQYYYYGFFKIRVMQKTNALLAIRHLIPSLFILAIMLSSYISYINQCIWPVFTVLGAYFSFNIVFTIYESLRKGFKLLVLLPLVFFLMHISYGVGFIMGFFNFLNKWGDKRLVASHFDKDRFIENTDA